MLHLIQELNVSTRYFSRGIVPTMEFLSQAALARRLGINRLTLHRDRERAKAKYPRPTSTLDGAPIYEVKAVERWEAKR